MLTADLHERTAIVTGAASGIGLATATLLARSGAQVALNDRPGNPRLDDAVRRLADEGLRVLAAPGDVGDAVDAARMVTDAAHAMGRLDFLVNNAATPGTTSPIPPADFERQDEAFWQRLLSVNLLGPYRCTVAAAPHLRATRGAIVNTASISAFGGGGSSSVYCATKAALVNLTREHARALGPEVRVNAIAPGIVDSDWECRFAEDSERLDRVPLRRRGQPEDYAEVIVFLLAGAAYMTGETVAVSSQHP